MLVTIPISTCSYMKSGGNNNNVHILEANVNTPHFTYRHERPDDSMTQLLLGLFRVSRRATQARNRICSWFLMLVLLYAVYCSM